LDEAISQYELYMREHKGNKLNSAATTASRLRAFFPDLTVAVGLLEAGECAGYYEDLTKRKSRTGRPMSVDTHRNMLAEARTFLEWCVGKK
jgi:hypothetical protein